MMPIFMTFLFYSMSSGLVFYWTISNLLTVLQQIRMYRKMPKAAEAPPEEPPPKRPKKKTKRR
jgi:membrane protein insertase Oxa1/YidC/SpoIIIJ